MMHFAAVITTIKMLLTSVVPEWLFINLFIFWATVNWTYCISARRMLFWSLAFVNSALSRFNFKTVWLYVRLYDYFKDFKDIINDFVVIDDGGKNLTFFCKLCLSGFKKQSVYHEHQQQTWTGSLNSSTHLAFQGMILWVKNLNTRQRQEKQTVHHPDVIKGIQEQLRRVMQTLVG